MTTLSPGVLSPLRVRNYRLQWLADLFVSWSFEMEVMLLGWYVLTQSDSVFLMSVIGAMPFVGTLASPIFGMVGDRIGLRNLLCLMRAFYLMIAAMLLGSALSGLLSVPVAMGLAAAMGLGRPSDLGVRTALVANTVHAGILPNAMGLSRTTFDSARVFGALSGASIFAVFGLASAYMLVVACYAAGLLLTLAITNPPSDDPGDGADAAAVLIAPPTSPLRELLDGFGYVWRTPKLLAGMWLGCLVNFTAFPLSIGLMPYVARNVLGADERVLGYLLASFATGALVGSVIIMVRRRPAEPARAMIVWGVVWHLLLIAFAQTKSIELAMLTQFGAGIAQSLSMLSLAVMLLQVSERRLRGRVMGVRMMAIYTLPIGLMLAGVLIPVVGFPALATGYATIGLVLTIVIGLAWRRSLWHRPVVPGAPAGLAGE